MMNEPLKFYRIENAATSTILNGKKKGNILKNEKEYVGSSKKIENNVTTKLTKSPCFL